MRAIEKLLVSKRLLLHLARDLAPVAMFQSFSVHDLVLADVIFADLAHDEYKSIHMFTLNPGQIPDQILHYVDYLKHRYGNVLHVYSADTPAREQWMAPNNYSRQLAQAPSRSLDHAPLKPVLQQKKALICTIDPSGCDASNDAWIVWDRTYHIPRFNPLSRWTHEELMDYVRHYRLPIDPGVISDKLAPDRPDNAQGMWWQTKIASGLTRQAPRGISTR